MVNYQHNWIPEVIAMAISSQAARAEGSTTTGLPDVQAQVGPSALPRFISGEDIVSSAWKHAAVKQAFDGRWKVTTDGCWEWTGGRSHDYGQLRIHAVYGPWPVYAHRIAYVLNHGQIVDGMSVLHRCDNPPCVNPEHLFMGTQAANMRDMAAKGRSCLGEHNGQAKLSDEDVRNIRAETGMLQQELAAKYGISDTQVSRLLRGTRRSDRLLRTTHGNAKMTEDNVRAIYALRDAGMGYDRISVQLGFHRITIRDAAVGKSWKRLYQRHNRNDVV